MERGLRRALSRVRLLVLDVDGVLTDGGIYYSESGEELKKFSTRDGHGLGMVRDAGIQLAIVTAEDSPIVTARAAKLQIEDVFLGAKEKGSVLRDLRTQKSLDREDICYVGDDLGDLPAFAEVGIRVAVADAVQPVKEAATFVTSKPGGNGAVREVCDMLLDAQRRGSRN